MALASLKDLYFDELADLYDAETQLIRTLPRLGEAARAPELREALRKHCEESRLHLERLELIFTHWGERRRSRPCAGLAGIVQEADDRLNQATTDDTRDAAIIGAAQRIEHYEIAAYGCARTYARRLNRLDEARLLQETLDDEGRTDRRLTEMAEARINDDARLETDFEDDAPARRLRYVPMDAVAKGRDAHQPLAIRNDSDEELGVLDGLLAENDLGAVRYAIVDAGGVLARRRYLLPITMLRFDETDRVLRVNVDKQVAERYPSFDSDEFEKLNDADRLGYERHLLRFFPRVTDRPPDDRTVGTLPEWLLKGTWITVPPDQADRLPQEARTFVNEFAPTPSDDREGPGSERVIARDLRPPAVPGREPPIPPRSDSDRSNSDRSDSDQSDSDRSDSDKLR
jgi:ferritin-like metal-binding protein YciE